MGPKRFTRFDRAIQKSDWEKRREQGEADKKKLLTAQMAAGATVHLAVLTVCHYCRSKGHKQYGGENHNGSSGTVLCGKDNLVVFKASTKTEEVNCSECLASMDEGLESGLLEPDTYGRIQDLTEEIPSCGRKYDDEYLAKYPESSTDGLYWWQREENEDGRIIP